MKNVISDVHVISHSLFACLPSQFLQTGTRIYVHKRVYCSIWEILTAGGNLDLISRISRNRNKLYGWTATTETIVSFRERSFLDLSIQMHRKVFKCNCALCRRKHPSYHHWFNYPYVDLSIGTTLADAG